MKRALVAAAIALGGLIVPAVSHAQATTTQFNERSYIASGGLPLCGGEEVVFRRMGPCPRNVRHRRRRWRPHVLHA